jgi:hypothetical protein
MASTTPAAAPVPQEPADGSGADPGPGRPAGVPMRVLLASCASAAAVSTPPAAPAAPVERGRRPAAPPRAA